MSYVTNNQMNLRVNKSENAKANMSGVECVDFIPELVHLVVDFIYINLWIFVATWLSYYLLLRISEISRILYYLSLMIHYDGWYAYMVAEELRMALDKEAAAEEVAENNKQNT
jgi:hypothetical protein